ncbi:hypothetical protein PAPHI01_0682 [Pancytospora philotis]|nr:hypothetical protein PAPHI01_0682 [Pancytospora philotis]
MRCTAKVSWISTCFAAYMWRKAGLLTDKDAARLLSADTYIPANDSGSNPGPCSRFAHSITVFPEPVSGDEPLEIEEGVSYVTVFSLYNKWRKQSHEDYQDKIRAYVEHAYKENSFEKRREGNALARASFVKARTEELKRLFSSTELLLESCKSIRLLGRAYISKYEIFVRMLKAISYYSRNIAEYVACSQDKGLEDLSEDVIKRLNLARVNMENHFRVLTNSQRFPRTEINRIVDEAPEVADKYLIDKLEEYCNFVLKYIYRAPKKISKDLVCARPIDQSAPYMFARFVYPELRYEAWGSFWRAALNQLYNEVKALKKYASEMRSCLSNCAKLVPMLIEDVDAIFEKHNRNISSCASGQTPESIRSTIDREINAIADRMLSKTHGEAHERTTINEAALASELRIYPEDEKSDSDY